MATSSDPSAHPQHGHSSRPSTTDASTTSVHPICANAPDQEKCERFVERLSEASDNIDRRDDTR